ncbi:MAG: GntR family transcriptional regulator [Homoserinimonas sp.]
MPVPSAHAVHKRSLLRDDVYSSIRDAIVDGTFAPGERLRDSELELWLGVSRTPIREGLLRLERAGLVIAQPGKATLVAPYDLASTVSAQQVVAAMHELAARLSVASVTEVQIQQMADANGRFSRALESIDVEAALSADDDFHATFVAASRNKMIAEVLEQMTPVLRRVERMRFGSFSARDSVTQHAEIVRLTRLRNVDGAALACRENWLSLRYASAV